VANRRWFHAHAELSFEEFLTSAKVAELLRSYGITEIHENVAKVSRYRRANLAQMCAC
jgi:metal-dependent amidase/aminoacylase/carboxypeptidase family protein